MKNKENANKTMKPSFNFFGEKFTFDKMYKNGKILNEKFKDAEKSLSKRERPKQVAAFLKNNNKGLILLRTIPFALNPKYSLPKTKEFLELACALIPECGYFDLCQTGYVADYAVKEEYAARLMNALEEIGYVFYKNGKEKFLRFSLEDYECFINEKINSIKLSKFKSNKYKIEHTLEPTLYKRPQSVADENICVNDIGSIMDKYREENVNRHNKEEGYIKELLDKLNIEYEYQKIVHVNDSFYIADFYLPKFGIIIEVDGGVHFSSKEALLRDRKRDSDFAKIGILTIRFDIGEYLWLYKAEQALVKILG